MLSDGQLSSTKEQEAGNAFERWTLSMLPVIAVATFPVFFLYFQNAGETSFLNGIVPLLIFIAAASAFYIVFLLLTRYAPKAAIITSLFMLVLQNYAIIEKVVQKIIPSLRYWQILPIGLFILVHIAWLVKKKLPRELAKTITFVIGIVFFGLILFNGVVAAPTIIKKISYNSKLESIETTQPISKVKNLPNIYYLIFDEYASFKQIKNSYGFDNSSTAEKLEKLGFNISYNSYNESLYTTTVMTNILNMNYIVDNEMQDSEKGYVRHNNTLFAFLKKRGYSIIGVGDPEFYGLEDIAFSNWQAETAAGESFSEILFQNTVFYPAVKIAVTVYMNSILESIQFMLNANNFPTSGQFTLFHLQCPHTPFVFDENGRQIAYENYMNWKEKKYYLGQYKYVTPFLLEIVESLIERDPNSIIILQSDHGARQGIGGKVDSFDDIHCILNAVYYKGEPFTDIEGLSGVNTMRVLINRLFNQKYEIVEVPEDNYVY